MTVTEANAVNVLIAWITGDARHRVTGHPGREEAVSAACSLAQNAYKTLSAGWRPDELDDAWPPETAAFAPVGLPRLTVRFSVAHLLDDDDMPSVNLIRAQLYEIGRRIAVAGIEYGEPSLAFSEHSAPVGVFELARREPTS